MVSSFSRRPTHFALSMLIYVGLQVITPTFLHNREKKKSQTFLLLWPMRVSYARQSFQLSFPVFCLTVWVHVLLFDQYSCPQSARNSISTIPLAHVVQKQLLKCSWFKSIFPRLTLKVVKRLLCIGVLPATGDPHVTMCLNASCVDTGELLLSHG